MTTSSKLPARRYRQRNEVPPNASPPYSPTHLNETMFLGHIWYSTLPSCWSRSTYSWGWSGMVEALQSETATSCSDPERTLLLSKLSLRAFHWLPRIYCSYAASRVLALSAHSLSRVTKQPCSESSLVLRRRDRTHRKGLHRLFAKQF